MPFQQDYADARIGIGNRGTYDLSCFFPQPDVQFVAVVDIKADRRAAVKKISDTKYGNNNCDTYRDFRELLDRGQGEWFARGHGGGVLEWGSHCVDLCQWAMGDKSVPVTYNAPKDNRLTARYADGVELVIRDDGWLPLGSCPVRFEGENGWVEAGDSGRLALSSPALLAGQKVAKIGGYPATFHVRNFLDCVKTRNQPVTNADAACNAHIVCHAANIALFLDRKLTYDPITHEFIDDEQANRLRSEALREPWRI